MTDYERNQAIKEGHQIQSADAYFAARPHLSDDQRSERVFGDGFRRGWDAGRATLMERIAELEAKLAQRVPEWHGLVEGERDQIVTDICEYGTGFVTPLYAIVEGVERKLMERNAAPAAPEQQDHSEQHLGMVDQAPNAQQAEPACASETASGESQATLRADRSQQGLAQQAEAQEPCEYQFQDSDGKWHGFMDERHRLNTIADGSWPIRELFTRPQPAQLEQLTQRVTELENALFEALSAFAEVYHATTNPAWFTKGKGAALQHSLMWQKKGAAVVKAALQYALAAKNGVNLK